MKHLTLLLPAALIVMLTSGQASAIAVANDPSRAAAASSTYQNSGVINSIDLGSRAIVIEGTSYLFPSTTVKLHKKTKTVTNAQQLKKGMRIGFNSKPGSVGSRAQITDVWVLE